MSIPAVTSAVKTISNRVCAVTGMLKPVVMPLLIVPILINPVKGGDKVTVAPGIGAKILSGTLEEYNCAVIVTELPIKARLKVVLIIG